jgi:hypothetical protein
MLTEALTLTDNAQGSPHSVALAGTGTGSGQDFTVTARNNQTAVSPGGTATYILDVSPTGSSFSKPVTFACTGAPAFAACTATPQSVNLGSNAATVTITVQTARVESAMQTPAGRRNSLMALWIFAPLGLFGVLLLGSNSCHKRAAQHAALVMVTTTLLLLTGCGGASSTTGSELKTQVTPPRTYILSVLAFSGTIQHSVALTLTVQ